MEEEDLKVAWWYDEKFGESIEIPEGRNLTFETDMRVCDGETFFGFYNGTVPDKDRFYLRTAEDIGERKI